MVEAKVKEAPWVVTKVMGWAVWKAVAMLGAAILDRALGVAALAWQLA